MLALPVLEHGELIGEVREITTAEADGEAVPALLTRWRTERGEWFLTQFTPTVERTRHWLRNIVLPDVQRKLCAVAAADGSIVGTIGALHLDQPTVEIDNILRGERRGHRDLMFRALTSFITWLLDVHRANAINLFVMSTNDRAIALYRRLGFADVRRYVLDRTEHGNEVTYRRAGPVEHSDDLHLLEMHLAAESFSR
jgi:RimJ/RimL family protein N-acetyltransferase